jgi:signal transduction histidine kinase
MPDAHRTCIYRVVQEALTNCARHANAHNVRILVTGDGYGVSVKIEDDGVGLSGLTPAGMGLIGIAERVRELNGTVQIEPGAQRGTTLHVQLPVTVGTAL